MQRTEDETDVMQLIQMEYAEFPGMVLTKPQAQLLFGIDEGKCDAVLDRLVEAKVLCRTPGQAYRLNRDNR